MNKWFTVGFGLGLLFIILTMICSTAGDQPSVALTQGQAAPYAGVLVSPDRVQRIDDLSNNLATQTNIVSLQQQEIDILNTRIKNANDEANNLSKRLSEQDSHSHLYEVTMFVLGAGVTGLVSYGIFRASH
jgi:hypothetical protein